MIVPFVRLLDSDPGYNAAHSGLFVRIWRDVPCRAAVLAQEIYEVRFLLCRGLFPAMLIPSVQREMELRGHTVEAVMAARYYGKDFDTYLFKEARQTFGYTQFAGWTSGRVLDEMHKRRQLAVRWVDRHGFALMDKYG